MKRELPNVQTGFTKGRGTRDGIVNILEITEKQRNSRKTSASLTTLKTLTVWITTNWKILQEMGIPDPVYLPPDQLVYRSGSKSLNQTWNNRLVPNWERSMSRLFIITLLI